MDKFLTDSHIQMLIDMPEGKYEPEIKDNADLGATVQLFVLFKALKACTVGMLKQLEDLGEIDVEKFTDEILKIVKKEIMEEVTK